MLSSMEHHIVNMVLIVQGNHWNVGFVNMEDEVEVVQMDTVT